MTDLTLIRNEKLIKTDSLVKECGMDIVFDLCDAAKKEAKEQVLHDLEHGLLTPGRVTPLRRSYPATMQASGIGMLVARAIDAVSHSLSKQWVDLDTEEKYSHICNSSGWAVLDAVTPEMMDSLGLTKKETEVAVWASVRALSNGDHTDDFFFTEDD